MPLNINIRKMKISDFEQVHKLIQQVHNLHVNNLPQIYKNADPLTFEYFSNQLSDINTIAYVAELNNTVVGEAISFVKEIKDDKILCDNKILHIDDICVDEKYRRKNIGKLLYNELENFANNNSFNCIQLNVWNFNNSAIKFYDNAKMNPIFIRYEKRLLK